MHLFKPVLKPQEEDVQFLVYTPRTFEYHIPDQAVPFARSQELDPAPQPFVISGLVAETTKLSELEHKNFQTRVQGEVLSRLKAIEEKAYAEAHALGMKEGRDQGFQEMKADVQAQVDRLKVIVETLSTLKTKLVASNEQHLIETTFHLAKAMALDQIHENPANITAIIAKALENAQSEEEIILRLNPQDFEFLNKVRETAGNPFEKLNRLKIESSESVAPGGVVVETNYGIVDASIEQRVKKVRDAIQSQLPSKDGEKA
jgi:flagellar assembly protein FliH